MANSIAKLPAHRTPIVALRHRNGAAQFLINSAHSLRDSEQLFDIDHWQQQNLAVTTDSGRGTAWFVDAPGHALVLRQFHRGGAVRRLFGDKYLYIGAERTRSFHEFRLLSTLWGYGLAVPEPIAARFERHGAVYRAHLVTRRIPQAISWSTPLSQPSPGQQPWQQIGKTIAMFHHFGACHADLNAHNILLSPDNSEIWLIDFDKGSIKSASDDAWRMGNLARLHRSINKIVADTRQPGIVADGWIELVASYTDHFARYGAANSAQ